MYITLKRKNKNVGDRTYPVVEGSTYTENYNETLDSATIRISHWDEKIDIEPFDKVELFGEFNTEKIVQNTCGFWQSQGQWYASRSLNIDNILVENVLDYSYEIIAGQEYIVGEPQMSIEQGNNRVSIIFDAPISQSNDAYKITVKIHGVYKVKIHKYMCVDTYTETMESLDPETYSYEITLFSRTKELENIILPNKSITQSKTNRSVWYYLKQYINNSYTSNRVWMRHQNGYFVARYTFDENNYDFENKFSKKCPEMQWNNPTLREVLTSLMMVCDCIPVVKDNNKIGFIDLTKTYNEVKNTETKHINYVQASQSSEDYVSELRMDMQNVMQTSVDNVKQTISKIEDMTMRPEDGSYVITEENMCFKTEYPILRVKHLYLTFPTLCSGQNGSVFQMVKYDLCNLRLKDGRTVNIIYEKQEYDTLPAQRYRAKNFNEIGQANCIYFTRGSNCITGFSNFYKKNWWANVNKLENLKHILVNEATTIIGPYTDKYQDTSGDPNRWFSTFFTIEYETTADAVFQAGKDIAPTHERVVADNQTYSFVDAYNQGNMEYQKANRLGNKQLFINARYENDYEHLIKIGDIYDTDNVIYQTQYQFYKNHIEVNATATKNYILRDYFTGVKARIRSWQIADYNSSFISHHLIKYYLEFSKKVKNEYFGTTIPYVTLPFTQYFLSPLNETMEIQPLKYCFVQTLDESSGTYRPGGGEYYTLELLQRIVGNSIIFTFGFLDNYNAGEVAGAEMTTDDISRSAYYFKNAKDYRHVFQVTNDYVDDYGGIPLSISPYTDNNGEMLSVEYHFSYNINFPYFPENYQRQEGNEAIGSPKEKTFLYYTTHYPFIYSYTYFQDYEKVSGHFNYIFKDNREILKISTQFEFCSDTHDIVFTKRFLEMQECIRNNLQRTTFTSPAINFATNDYVQTQEGGTFEVSNSNIAQFFPTIYGGSYYEKIESLANVPSSMVHATITASDTPQHSNTVNFIPGPSHGTFQGEVYGTTRETAKATITYVVAGIYKYTAVKTITISDTINRVVSLVSINKPHALSDADITIVHNRDNGQFTITVVFADGDAPPLSAQDITFTYAFSDTWNATNPTFLFVGDVSKYDWKNPSLEGATIDNTAQIMLIHDSNTNSRIVIGNVANNKAYYIVNASNEILIATNNVRTIYLNLLLSRDYNVYDTNGNVVGSID